MKKKTTHEPPHFGELSVAECNALLRRHHVGRIAFTFHDRVDVEPIGYVFADGWIIGRTSPGTKLTTLQHHPWVAFEVDEAEGQYDWQSVVVHGTAYFLTRTGTTLDREAYDEAVRTLRGVDKRVLTADDPVPERTVVIRIKADELTGRRASTAK